MDTIIFIITFLIIGYFFASYTFKEYLEKAISYNKSIEHFAEKIGIKYLEPKINKRATFSTLVFSWVETPRQIVYKKDDFLKEKIKKEEKEKPQFFPIEEDGNDFNIYNLCKGPYKGREVQIYNYQIPFSGWFSKTTYCQIYLKDSYDFFIYIRPEKIDDKFPIIAGGKDIELEYQDFNKKYRVKASNPKFAFEMLDPVVMDEMMKYKNICLMISHDSLIIAQFEELEPDQIQKNLDLGIKIAEAIDK